MLKLPGGTAYRLTCADYMTGFALPNFSFHATTAYAILCSAGGHARQAGFRQHLGPPNPDN